MIIENSVPFSEYEKLQEQLEEYENALGYFLDEYLKAYGDRELMRSAIKGGLSKEFIMREVLTEEDLYNEVYAELVAEGEILVDEEADED
ncbi:MAG: hypothetical protein IIU77_03595 [Clostridia bacterium]|nr:hypothetical protein [Clostridia bacterium]